MQFIKDYNGSTTAVIIPISEWHSITEKHKDLKQLEKGQLPVSQKNIKPSDLAGTLSEEGYLALNKHINEARNEWDRNTF